MNHRHVRSLLWLAVAVPGLVQAQQTGTAQSITGRAGGGGQRDQGATIVVGGGFESTDNAFKSTGTWSGCDKHPNTARPDCIPVDDETKEFVDLDLGYLREGSALSADVQYNAELANYENDTTKDDSRFQGRSRVAWSTLGQRLVLDATHQRTEQIQDPRNPDIINNSQLRDIISAGPTLTARLSPVDDLVVNGRWSDISYDESDRDPVTTECPPGSTPGVTPGCPAPNAANPDSQRVEGGVAWRHKLARTDVISANYQYMESEFDDTDPTAGNPDPIEQITYQRLYASYEVALRTSGYTIALGANRSERDDSDSSDGFLAQVSWHLETAGHRVRLVALNELTDSSIGLGGNPLASGGGYGPQDGNFDVVDVVERTHLDLSWSYERICERCLLDIGVTYDEQDFDVEPRDMEMTGVRASFDYRITSTLTASLRATASETDYPEDALGSRTDKRSLVGLMVDWRMSRALRSRFWISTDTRESDALGADYDELFGGASVRYEFR